LVGALPTAGNVVVGLVLVWVVGRDGALVDVPVEPPACGVGVPLEFSSSANPTATNTITTARPR